MTRPIYLFVYGTLRPGHAPAWVAPHVDPRPVVGPGSTPGRLYDLGNYPGCVVDPECSDRVHGLVLQIPDEATLAKFDAYEGYKPGDPARSLFVRTECDVTLDDGNTLRAAVYVYNRTVSAARLIPGGRYDPANTMRRPVIGITMDHANDLS